MASLGTVYIWSKLITTQVALCLASTGAVQNDSYATVGEHWRLEVANPTQAMAGGNMIHCVRDGGVRHWLVAGWLRPSATAAVHPTQLISFIEQPELQLGASGLNATVAVRVFLPFSSDRLVNRRSAVDGAQR
jgi:hypothetical protein